MNRDQFLRKVTACEYLSAAFYFAKKCHGKQKRKYTNDPYIIHPVSVAQILTEYTNDSRVLAAALLHDVIEDTSCTENQIYYCFGKKVADLVMEVTDVSKPWDGNRAKRKEMDRQHLANASYEGKMIKLADLIDNTSSIVEYGKKFAGVYLDEMRLLLDVLEGSDSMLYMRAVDVYEDGVFRVHG